MPIPKRINVSTDLALLAIYYCGKRGKYKYGIVNIMLQVHKRPGFICFAVVEIMGFQTSMTTSTHGASIGSSSRSIFDWIIPVLNVPFCILSRRGRARSTIAMSDYAPAFIMGMKYVRCILIHIQHYQRNTSVICQPQAILNSFHNTGYLTFKNIAQCSQSPCSARRECHSSEYEV